MPEIIQEECSYTVSNKGKISTYFLQKDKSIGVLFGFRNHKNKDDVIKEFENEFTPFKKIPEIIIILVKIIKKCNLLIK